ncbi:hypothetical protein BGZ63DRAFT_370057, partial [Mariannaea sp. PMI_226]
MPSRLHCFRFCLMSHSFWIRMCRTTYACKHLHRQLHSYIVCCVEQSLILLGLVRDYFSRMLYSVQRHHSSQQHVGISTRLIGIATIAKLHRKSHFLCEAFFRD